jgi:hypothetical protein
MNIRGLSERDQKTLRLGVAAALIILVTMFVAMPLLEQLERINKSIRDEDSRIRRVESELRDHAAWTRLRKELEEHATLHNTETSLNEQTARMLAQVERLPSYQKLSVHRLEAIPVRNEETYYRSGVTMQFSGTLTALHAFLAEAEQAKPRLKVDRITVTTSAKDPSRLEGNLVLHAFAVAERKASRG